MTDSPLAHPPVSHRWLVRGIGAAVILLGALALIGWAFHLDVLIRLAPTWPRMKPNTAFILVFAGGGLLGLTIATPRRRVIVHAASAVVLVIAVATMMEHVIGIDLGIDELLFRDAETGRGLQPGRMASATSFALVLVGAMLGLLEFGARHAVVRVARLVCACIVAIGVLSLLGRLFHVTAVYAWYPFDPMAVSTAGALVLLGIGLLVVARIPTHVPHQLTEDQRIIHAAASARALAAGATGIVGAIALDSHVRRSAEGELRDLLTSHVAELTTNLELRATRAAIVTTRPNLRRNLRLLVSHPNNADARQVVQGVLASFLSHDFSSLVASLPGGEEVARAGDDAPPPTLLKVPISGAGNASLLWRRGMTLRHELELTDAEGPLGSIVTEQRMPRVNEMLTGDSTRFASAEFLLCGAEGGTIQCFPSRRSADPVVVPPGSHGSRSLAQRAFIAGTGVSTTVDYRGRQVLGAYTTLPSLGLAAVLKADVNELYAPARWQFGVVLLLVLALTAGGVALVRLRVGPLATRLEQRVEERTADLRQVNARLSILHAVDRGLIAEQSPEDIAEAILEPLRDLLGVPRVMVILFDLEAGEAEWLAAAGRRRIRVGRGVRYSLELAGDLEALRRGEPQVIDVETLAPNPDVEALLKSGVRFYVVMPMIAGGTLVGGLSFGGPVREFSPDQFVIAEEIARQMAIVIEKQRLTRTLLQTNQTLGALVTASPLAMWTVGPDGIVSMWNPTAERMFGWKADEVLGRPLPIVPEDRRHEFTATMAKVLEGETVTGVETQRQRNDGTLIDVSLAFAALRDTTGAIAGVTAIAAEMTARLALETQLRQAQKLEAIGRLAGGIAHDFNNLLTVIGGRSHLMNTLLAPDDPLRRNVEIIEKTAERAAALTHQLLAFSRRQALVPRVVDLNEVVTGMARILQRLIGEDIQLVTVPNANRGHVRVDPSQTEQVVLNLAVNARDAMPDGGRLTIALESVDLDAAAAQRYPGVDPGAYVRLAVSDTGHGMDAATQAQLFVPFFTTKGPDKGTGLGLATVYGIVKQSGGHIRVLSEVGRGSTFEIYLPRVDAPVDMVITGALQTTPPRGTETILLAEDDAAVRALARDTLLICGYMVLEAAHPDEAVHIAETCEGPIHLLLTDVVMPGMSGRVLANKLVPLRTGLQVLFMSGYTADAIGHHGVLAPGTAFLQKPFTPSALARRVREALDTGQ